MRVIALISLVTVTVANICLRPRLHANKLFRWVIQLAFRDAAYNHYTGASIFVTKPPSSVIVVCHPLLSS